MLSQKNLRTLSFRNTVRSVALIITGITCATIGLKGFLLPNGFLDGGVTGISLLINRLTGWDLSLLIFLINLPFIYVATKQVGRNFAIYTLLAIAVLSFAVHFITLPHLTNDKLLISIFGGFFVGAGIGLCMRGGCVIDGTEVLAIQVTRTTPMSVGDFIAVFNISLFIISAILINLETALYSMLTYLAASRTIDFLITGIEEYIGVTIISHYDEDIRQMIINNLGRAVTVYKGEGGYGKSGLVENDRKILFCVVTRLEVQKMITEIEMIDPNAFVIQHTINDTRGGMIKRRPLH
jgi:uncharacterized membrane-anchored protein YitT (DUF2179 family)